MKLIRIQDRVINFSIISSFLVEENDYGDYILSFDDFKLSLTSAQFNHLCETLHLYTIPTFERKSTTSPHIKISIPSKPPADDDWEKSFREGLESMEVTALNDMATPVESAEPKKKSIFSRLFSWS